MCGVYTSRTTPTYKFAGQFTSRLNHHCQISIRASLSSTHAAKALPAANSEDAPLDRLLFPVLRDRIIFLLCSLLCDADCATLIVHTRVNTVMRQNADPRRAGVTLSNICRVRSSSDEIILLCYCSLFTCSTRQRLLMHGSIIHSSLYVC